MTVTQITLDGREVPYEQVVRSRRSTLTPQQREILRTVRARGSIRASEAGRVMHAARGYCEWKAADYPMRNDLAGCCAYCASDGWSALKRLRERGFLIDHRHEWMTLETYAQAVNVELSH